MGIKLVIVGGVAGGATAAARARRVSEDAEIVVFERGEYVITSYSIHYTKLYEHCLRKSLSNGSHTAHHLR